MPVDRTQRLEDVVAERAAVAPVVADAAQVGGVVDGGRLRRHVDQRVGDREGVGRLVVQRGLVRRVAEPEPLLGRSSFTW